MRLKKLGDLMLYRVGCESGYVAGEVLYGEEEALIVDDSDADDVEIGVEEIGAMDWSGHPYLLEGRWSVTVSGVVFGDGAEAGPGVGASGDEVGLTGILVEEFPGAADDPLEMCMRCTGERAVPTERREVVLGPGLVGELEERLLGGGGVGLGEGGRS